MDFLPLLLAPFLAMYGLGWLAMKVLELVRDWIATLRFRQRAAKERDSDRTQMEVRATILRVAGELGADAHEARKALIRESYLAGGRGLEDE